MMKHLRNALWALVIACCPLAVFAVPGDTTVLVTSPLLNADNSTSYDTTVALPTTKTYRKIFLVYTLNSHVCTTGGPYCHQWDYIGNVTLKTPHGDTVELDRIITPFATSGWSRFPNPPNWSEDYVFDVTDFAPYLNGTVTINSGLGVGSPGYGIQTKFIFIEGTPDRNTVGITPVYAHGGTYGSAANPIDNNFPVRNLTAPAGTVSADFRFILSGHGSDTFGCCEFASHYYDLLVNGSAVQRQQIWRTCGFGELYPQGGTWLFDRANWCPGASVLPYYDPLPGVTAGTSYNLNVSFEPYTVPHPSGNYDANASVVYFGGMNKTLDASLDDIIAPSTSQQHFRENPGNNLPIVRVHNSGSTTISSVSFLYGVKDSALQTYTWNGSLASLADTLITLPAATSIAWMSLLAAAGSTHSFIAAITGVNGVADNDQTNDTLRSQFVVAPRWPDTIGIRMLTSNLGADGNLNTSPADAAWYITNINGDTIYSRTNTASSTLYNDTITLPVNGYYKFTISTPANCAGLHYWLYDDQVSGYAPGYLWIKKMSGALLPMHGYTYTGSTTPSGLLNLGEHDDFGCGFSQYFYVSTASTEAVPVVNNSPAVAVYPNPANSTINIDFANMGTGASSVTILNVLGQAVYTHSVTTDHLAVNTIAFAPGVYTIMLHTDNSSRNIGKVVVAH